MQKPNSTVMDIDERKKGRQGIKEMLDRLSEMKDSSDSKPLSPQKETA